MSNKNLRGREANPLEAVPLNELGLNPRGEYDAGLEERRLQSRLEHIRANKVALGNKTRNTRLHQAAAATGLSLEQVATVVAALGVDKALKSADLKDELMEEHIKQLMEVTGKKKGE